MSIVVGRWPVGPSYRQPCCRDPPRLSVGLGWQVKLKAPMAQYHWDVDIDQTVVFTEAVRINTRSNGGIECGKCPVQR